MSEHALFIEHTMLYSNKEPLPIQDVVDSLLAMQRLSRKLLPQAVSKLTESEILQIDVLVDGIEEGSFKESFLLRVLFANEASMERFLKALRAGDLSAMYKELPLEGKPVIKTLLLSSVIAALVSYGVLAYMQKTDNQSGQALIEANNNTIIAIGAEAYQVDPEAFEKVIRAVSEGKKKALAEDAAKILAPAQREDGATVSIGEKAVIPHDIVRRMPRSISFEPVEVNELFENVEIDIRQTNRDSAESGWRGRITGMFDDRVKLTIGDDVKLDDLVGRLSVRADVSVRYVKRDGQRDLKPVEIVLLRLQKPTPKP